MNILKGIRSVFDPQPAFMPWPEPKPTWQEKTTYANKPQTAKQLTAKGLVAEHLKKHGRITAWEVQTLYRTTDARKMMCRLKREGVVSHVTYEPNQGARGTHAVYWYNKGGE